MLEMLNTGTSKKKTKKKQIKTSIHSINQSNFTNGN